MVLRAETNPVVAALNITGINMNFTKTSVALAIAVSALAAGSAQATTFNAGVIGTTSQSFIHTPGFFQDTINFSIAAPSNLTGAATSLKLSFASFTFLDIANLTVNLLNNSHPNGTVNYGSFAGNGTGYTFNLPAAGNYHIDITGVATGINGGTYGVALTAAPVPEPETYAMLLAGLGVMGAIARRRKQAA